MLEDIVHKQPKVNMDLNSIKTLYEHMDQLLLEYANTNVYAILSTYTSGEARSLVRQARRPNGFEAFRLLQVRFTPVTIGRQRAQLIKITNPQEGISLDKLAAEIVAWENRIVTFIELREEVFSYLDQVAPVAQAAVDIGSRCGERRRMLFVWRSAFDEGLQGQGQRQERWRRQR